MNRIFDRATLSAFVLSAVLLIGDAAPALAAKLSDGDRWNINAALYFWYASIGGRASTDTGIEVDTDDIVDNLDGAFMGIIGARKGKWSVMADLIYLSLEDDEKGIATVPIGPGVTAPIDAGIDLEGRVVTLSGARNVMDSEQATFDLLVGARYLKLESDLTIDIGAPAPPNRQTFSDSGSVWDAIIGVNGQIKLADKWYLSVYGDVGTGDSKTTWQAYAGIGYRFSNIDVEVAYRHIEWDFDDRPVFDDLNFSGPFAGVNIRF